MAKREPLHQTELRGACLHTDLDLVGLTFACVAKTVARHHMQRHRRLPALDALPTFGKHSRTDAARPAAPAPAEAPHVSRKENKRSRAHPETASLHRGLV
eukprot:2901908-Pleurochrysis_carterae.AAC.2